MSTVAHGDHAHHPTGITRWLFTTNHKDIGTLYLWFSFIMFIIGGTMALIFRTELFLPGMQFLDPQTFNELVSIHGLVMIFGALMPVLTGLANWLIPMMIGAPDMALPRLNNWSFWLLPFGFAFLLGSMFVPGGGPAGGWTMYPPLFIQGGIGYDMAIFAVHTLGVSSILGSLNIIATLLNMRAPGMTMMKMPMFCWGWFITSFLIIGIMPVIAGAVTMELTDRHFGTSFFNAAGGGDPIMFQHIFWFFGHPEVYVLVLPIFGLMSDIIPTFARKPLFGKHSMIYAIAAIAFLSYIVWAHHMFTVGMPIAGELYFMYATIMISVPTGVKIFNWLATMWRGSVTFEAPMMWALAFIALFAVGGFTGLMMGVSLTDFQYQDTYFIVSHFHWVVLPVTVFGAFAAFYYWGPKWTGHMYDETLAKWHFWITVIATNVIFLPQNFAGLAGMPRRIADYSPQFTEWNQISTVGAYMFATGQLLFLYIVLKTIKGKAGEKLPDQVWEGAEGLEWTVPTPAPYHTFETPPHVK
ncbi:cytochrome c oxidase subunit I [Candidatus Nitrosacidococcus tergens]|uniref:Cytochrome c oxidase subunit 1 n=1 Tax=Candidatus Nitrosacidococcus tergens TaxID=553981 RepID=A0A7G1QCR8_9GAMM|nr:cytochrome c oxidase subunit I [Candidatus Nitrosacidococcus tergens]CAB1277544.1 Cytochrome c oxidase, subunit I [Candidatus Nitrosacidococcus tergens]